MVDAMTGVILLASVLAIVWATYFLLFKRDEERRNEGQEKEANHAGKTKKERTNSTSKADEGKKGGKQGKGKGGQNQIEQKFTHPWLLSSLKGHTGEILDISLSPNDKFLASCADDRIAHVWVIKDITEKDHKRIRVNFPFDYATLIRWSPDSKAFVVCRYDEKMLEVFKLGRKPDNSVGNITPALQWPQEAGKASDFIGLDIACSGKFIMSCTKDGEIVLRDVKGSVLMKMQSLVQNPVKAKVSPCGRYVALAGTENVEIYEAKANAQGIVKELESKWQFKGLPPQAPAAKTGARGKSLPVGPTIADFAFNADASKMTVVSTKGTFAVFDIVGGNKAFTETSGQLSFDLTDGSDPVVAFTSDARVVTIGANGGIYTFSSFTGTLLHEIPNIYKDKVTRVVSTGDNKYLVTSGDNIIYIFRNLSWYKDTIRHLKAQLTDEKVTGALRTRMQSELSSLEEEFSKF